MKAHLDSKYTISTQLKAGHYKWYQSPFSTQGVGGLFDPVRNVCLIFDIYTIHFTYFSLLYKDWINNFKIHEFLMIFEFLLYFF